MILLFLLFLPVVAAAIVSSIENGLKLDPNTAFGKLMIFNVVILYSGIAVYFYIASALEHGRAIEDDPPRLAAAIMLSSALFYGAKLMGYELAGVGFTNRLLVPLAALVGLWLLVGLAFAVLSSFKMGN